MLSLRSKHKQENTGTGNRCFWWGVFSILLSDSSSAEAAEALLLRRLARGTILGSGFFHLEELFPTLRLHHRSLLFCCFVDHGDLVLYFLLRFCLLVLKILLLTHFESIVTRVGDAGRVPSQILKTPRKGDIPRSFAAVIAEMPSSSSPMK